MRKFLSVFVLSAAVLALNVSLLAKTATVTGKVVDEGCGLPAAAGGHGDHGGAAAGHGDHKMEADKGAAAAGGHAMPGGDMTECMIMCAKNGEPLALLTADGKVYRIAGGLAANKNAKLIAHVGKNVEITGDVVEKDGKVQIVADALKPAK